MSVTTYKTPGVYVEEATNLTVSIPNVATAIPAFLGVTSQNGNAQPKPKRIESFFEFKAFFGAPAAPVWTVSAVGDQFQILGQAASQVPTGAALLYYAVQWYFLNGGGACYIVATQADVIDQYDAGLEVLSKLDEPTLILPCGAVCLPADQYHSFCKAALAQAMSLRDRFCILDVRNDAVTGTGSQRVASDISAFRSGIDCDALAYGAAYYPNVATAMAWEYADAQITYDGNPLSDPTNKGVHGKVTAWLRSQRVTLPPSGAIAGVYATVDQDRGVWKAPANVSINYAGRPTIAIDDVEQQDMNVPGDKAQINAIRLFANKGTMVWGGRTLDYKSADWTYISVRRLFIMLEESIGKAIQAFVFEANDRSTWTSVKSSINSYLYQLWLDGGLVGGKAAEAYDVQIGLGETMTQDDVLSGRMIVDVRVAPVRPAEFIVIRFSQDVKAS